MNKMEANGVLDKLSRIEDLLLVIARAQLATTLERELSQPKMRDLYRMTGAVPQAQIAKRTGFSAGKISATWQRWEELGLLLKEGQRYRRVLE